MGISMAFSRRISSICYFSLFFGRNPAEYWILKTMGSKLGYLTTNDFSALEDALLV
jgi:hypothetical protein